jgi:hypothetical protein
MLMSLHPKSLLVDFLKPLLQSKVVAFVRLKVCFQRHQY